MREGRTGGHDQPTWCSETESTREGFSRFELSKTSTAVENTGMVRIKQATGIGTSLFLEELSTQNLIMKDG